MQDKFLKGLYRFFSIGVIASSLMYVSGGCKIKNAQVDDPIRENVTITSTSDSETTDLESTNKCKETTDSKETTTK